MFFLLPTTFIGISRHFKPALTEFLAICTYLFENENIKEVRDTFDRLTMAGQAVKGWIPKKIVGTIIKQSRKGLD